MPVVSVTVIGLVVGLAVGILRSEPARSTVQGIVAAWCGFVFGAFIGVLADALLGTGTWLAWMGHIGAVVATLLSFVARRPPETVGA